MAAKKKGVLSNLNRFPRHAKTLTHFRVDHIELLCITSQDGRFSKEDYFDAYQEEHDVHKDEDDSDEEGQDDTGRQSANIERINNEIDELYRVLKYRTTAFGQVYPFSLSADGGVLILKKKLSSKHELYVFCLLCSSLTYSSKKGSHQQLGYAFERLSAYALKNYLPKSAQVHVFGTSAKGLFKGSIWKKVQQLAASTRGKLSCEEEDLPRLSKGDGGVDLAAWIPMEDSNSGMIVILAQCGCTPEWVRKQNDAGYHIWHQRVVLKTPSVSMIFIPHCFRTSAGSWLREGDVLSVVVDRERFIRLLLPNIEHFLSEKFAMTMTKEALAFRRDLF